VVVVVAVLALAAVIMTTVQLVGCLVIWVIVGTGLAVWISPRRKAVWRSI